MEKLKPKPEQVLMSAIGFTEGDLEANRAGHISQAQRTRFTRARQFWIICLIIALAVGPTVAILAIINGINIHDTVSSRLGIIGLILIVMGLVAFNILLKMNRLADDLKSDEILMVEGRIRLDLDGGSTNMTGYHIVIQDVWLNVSKGILLAFKNGDPYAIYYAPRTKTLLSAEWLREE